MKELKNCQLLVLLQVQVYNVLLLKEVKVKINHCLKEKNMELKAQEYEVSVNDILTDKGMHFTQTARTDKFSFCQ